MENELELFDTLEYLSDDPPATWEWMNDLKRINEER